MNRKHTFLQWLIPSAFLFSVTFLEGCKHEAVSPGNTTSGTTPSTTSSTTTSGTTTSGTTGSTTGVVTCDPNTVYFEQQVLPILTAYCAKSGCHDAITAADGNNFTTHAGVMASGEVEPGEPGDSDLIEVLTEEDDPDKIMPPPGHTPPSASQIELIKKWISQGAQNNSCTPSEPCNSTNVTFSGTIKPIIETNCQGCHSGSAPGGGHNFSTYAGVKTAADANRLYGAVSHAQGFSAMPKNGQKLPDCTIEKIKAWIDAGAPNN